jgi:hypothetical protein
MAWRHLLVLVWKMNPCIRAYGSVSGRPLVGLGSLAVQTSIACLAVSIVCVSVVLLGSGCGRTSRGNSTVSGQVKLDGKPVEQGSILFLPMQGAKGREASGPIERGVYKLSAVAVGQNRVEIRTMRKTGQKVPMPYAKHGETVDEEVPAVAERFNSASTLTFEVKPGDNVADFEVLSK